MVNGNWLIVIGEIVHGEGLLAKFVVYHNELIAVNRGSRIIV